MEKWKKVFIKEEDWKRLIMELPRLKVTYTTQLFKFDMATLVVTLIALAVGVLIGWAAL